MNDKWQRFKSVTEIPLDCDPTSLLVDMLPIEADISMYKAIAAGQSFDVHWAIYIYRAEEMSGDGLYGYIASIVLFDDHGNPMKSEILSQYMAYEEYARIKRARLQGRTATVCKREKTAFLYDERTGKPLRPGKATALTREHCNVVEIFPQASVP